LLVKRGVLTITFRASNLCHVFELYFFVTFLNFIFAWVPALLREAIRDDDDRTLDAEEGCVSASAAGERVHDAGGCAAVSGVEAQSAFFAGAVVCGAA
jgi:hypothetical protein